MIEIGTKIKIKGEYGTVIHVLHTADKTVYHVEFDNKDSTGLVLDNDFIDDFLESEFNFKKSVKNII